MQQGTKTNELNNNESWLLLSPPPSSPATSHPVLPQLSKPSCSRRITNDYFGPNAKLPTAAKYSESSASFQLNDSSIPSLNISGKKRRTKRRSTTIKDWSLSTLLSNTSTSSFDFGRLTERQQLAMIKKRAYLESTGLDRSADERTILKRISPFVLDRCDENAENFCAEAGKRSEKKKSSFIDGTIGDKHTKKLEDSGEIKLYDVKCIERSEIAIDSSEKNSKQISISNSNDFHLKDTGLSSYSDFENVEQTQNIIPKDNSHVPNSFSEHRPKNPPLYLRIPSSAVQRSSLLRNADNSIVHSQAPIDNFSSDTKCNPSLKTGDKTYTAYWLSSILLEMKNLSKFLLLFPSLNKELQSTFKKIQSFFDFMLSDKDEFKIFISTLKSSIHQIFRELLRLEGLLNDSVFLLLEGELHCHRQDKDPSLLKNQIESCVCSDKLMQMICGNEIVINEDFNHSFNRILAVSSQISCEIVILLKTWNPNSQD